MIRQIRSISGKSKDAEKAFTERLKQLESEYEETQSLNFKSLIDKDSRLEEISKNLDQKKFELDNQQALKHAKIPSYAGKHTRDTALSQPWTGQENQSDSVLRLLVDKYKPLKTNPHIKKLAGAKQTVLDYTIQKNNPLPSEEDKKFKEIYQERFTPIGSFDKIKTIADARIEDAMQRGEFRNINRKQKLNNEVGAHVDRTEHHLNNILKNQNIVPPWIEKQGGVNGEILDFRNELKNKWEHHITHYYNSDTKIMEKEFLNKLSSLYDHQIQMVNSSIRTYNLQAPLSTQKFYLLKGKEFQRCFDEVNIFEVQKNAQEKKKLKPNTPKQEENGFSLKFWKW